MLSTERWLFQQNILKHCVDQKEGHTNNERWFEDQSKL